MNWDAIAAIGQVLGSVAVLVTLGYLAVQVRQTNRATRTASEQAVFANFVGLTANLVGDHDTVGIIRRGLADWRSLTPDEQATVHNYWGTLFGHLNMAHTLFKEGTLGESTYLDFENNAISALREPGLADWWQTASRGFGASIVERINWRLANTMTLPPRFTEVYPYYRA